MLEFFINSAHAADPAVSNAANAGIAELVLIGVFMLFGFFLIRSQNKKLKAQQNMLSQIAKGDEVVTNGGMIGKVTKLTDDFLVINIANDVDIKIQKQAINAILPKGTIKAIG